MNIAFEDRRSRAAEEALRASEARYKALVESIDEGLCVIEILHDASGTPVDYRFLEVNPAFARQTGLEDAVGRTIYELVPDFGSAWVQVYAEIARTGRPRRFERPASAMHRWFDVYAWRTDTGHVAILFKDITQRKQAEQALRDSEERYRLIGRATNDVVWDLDVETGHIEWNDAARARIGPIPEHFDDTVEGWAALLHPDDRDRVVNGLNAAIDDGRESWTDEYRLRKADGTYGVFVDRGYISRGRDGRATRMIGSMLEVTEQRVLEQRAAQTQRLEALGRFAGGIAHDFNNLLCAMMGYAELIDRAIAGTPASRHVGRLREVAERGSALTRQILAFARPQLGNPETIDLDEVLLSVHPMLRRLLSSDVELATIPSGRLWPVRLDRGQVEQVLINLVVNARDAIVSGGRITIDTHNVDVAPGDPLLPAGQWTRLTVVDDGAGMEADTLAHCFEPFFTTKEPDKGSGLGLASVWGIVEHAGGFVRVDSAPRRGTRFDVYFPRAETGQRAGGPAAEDRVGVVPTGTETVLVVEDEPTLRELAATTLGSLGYHVLAAADGVEALALVDRLSEPLHAVVTDVVMPLMNGRDLARQLRGRQPDLRVLFVSGYTDQPMEPSEAFLAKPFPPSVLARELRSLLDASPSR